MNHPDGKARRNGRNNRRKSGDPTGWSLLDAIPAHVAMLDAEGRIVATNRAWRDFASANGGDVLRLSEGANYLEVCECPPASGSEDAQSVAAAIRDVLAGRRKDYSYEYSCHSESEERWFVCRVLPFAGDDGAARAIVVHDNVTSVHVALAKAAARELALHEKLAQSARLEALGRLTGGMAHDFNNFLGIILGNLDLLGRFHAAESDGAKLIDAALRAAQHSADVIESLLALARRQPISLRPTAINRSIEDVAKILPRVLGPDIRLEFRLGADLAEVRLDGAQFNSCLINFASNARDAMPRGGTFTIATSQVRIAADDAEAPVGVAPGDYVLVEISDTGVGMPPEILARAFEPFYTTKGPGKGTGLGLSMVYGAIAQAGGHVVAASEVGKGTTFQIYLPRAAEGPASEIDLAVPTTERIGGAESVLVVDDNTALRETLSRQLESLGYSVCAAGDAVDALTILESGEFRPRLLLTDIVMAGRSSGLDLAEQVRRRWPDIRVLLISGFADASEADQAARLGAFSLLRKPFRQDDLARAIRTVLTDRS